MDIELFRETCLGLPFTTEDMPFDDKLVTFRLKGKIFACISTDNPDWAVMKCDPEYAQDLRMRYSAIEGAFHWNKKYWNQVNITCSDVPDPLITSLIQHAYGQVNLKLPRKDRVSIPKP